MAGAQNHQYHLVKPSPWPLIGAFSALFLFGGAVLWMHALQRRAVGVCGRRRRRHPHHVQLVVRRHQEAHSGDHTPVVQLHLRYGMILFIASEVMFFVAWFWAWFEFVAVPVRRSTRSAASGRPRAWRCSIRSAFRCSTP